ncbi:MAG: hypothetical protein KME03_11680 [Aphanocapsa lilacina HA4352-LM1]|uniref:Uncharacterized protein n=1 Tax=Gloeobacter morelensis MG652769 TaxID=2781736 RepID=A0ABY3PL67_9CYAN|nr:hypothetical protein [Gloeobacter morelensis]MBW4698530.1 hypothetical protein [Aphanocapsa lilacina HA4352-LM1]UFP94319.1 hypothetical protein ISF26_21650 [Gloeobacter morelensis MG652769]
MFAGDILRGECTACARRVYGSSRVRGRLWEIYVPEEDYFLCVRGC